MIWRATVDAQGDTELTIAEVWAAGARADGEVYAEMVERVRRLGVEAMERWERQLTGQG